MKTHKLRAVQAILVGVAKTHQRVVWGDVTLTASAHETLAVLRHLSFCLYCYDPLHWSRSGRHLPRSTGKSSSAAFCGVYFSVQAKQQHVKPTFPRKKAYWRHARHYAISLWRQRSLLSSNATLLVFACDDSKKIYPAKCSWCKMTSHE